MSARTIAPTLAATITHLARDARSAVPRGIVRHTLIRAREFVSVAHRVATASARDARASLHDALHRAMHALGYARTVTTGEPQQPARPCAPAAGTAAVPFEAKPVKPEATTDSIATPSDHPSTTASPSRAVDDGHPPPMTTDPSAALLASPPTTPPQGGASNMSELIEAIRAAVAQGATADQKAIGAQACRTILTALDVEPGKPIVLPGAPKPHPLSGITVDQALDLVIARLTMIANTRDAGTAPPATPQPERQGPQISPQPELRGPQIPLLPPSSVQGSRAPPGAVRANREPPPVPPHGSAHLRRNHSPRCERQRLDTATACSAAARPNSETACRRGNNE